MSESLPTQNFVVTAWPWPHLCRPAAAASVTAYVFGARSVIAKHGIVLVNIFFIHIRYLKCEFLPKFVGLSLSRR